MAWVSPAEMLMIHGLMLMVCGALAFQASGFQRHAMSAIYVGNGGAVVSFLLAVGMRDTTLKKGEAGYKTMMACVHLAVVYPLVIAVAVGWRLSKAWGVPEKAYLKPYFGAIVGVSLLATAVMVALKPKREKVKAEGGAVEEKEAGENEVEENEGEKDGESLRRRRPRKATAM